MTEKKIQIKDLAGNLLFPKTKGEVVFNDAGEHLGGVEAGAQVNKLEKITVNGVELTIVDKTAAITIAAQAEYSLAKQETAETGYSATYFLTKDGAAVGEKINIPKDMFVQSGDVKTCEEDDKPVEGLKVGDKYIDLLLANADDTHVYIPAKSLVDVYTGGNGITVSETNVIAIDTAVVATVEGMNTELAKKQDNLTTDQLAAANSGITADKVAAYDAHVANADIHVTAEQKTTWTAKQDALTEDQMKAVNSGITAEKVAAFDGYATTLEGKADKATTLAGYGITDAYTKTETYSKTEIDAMCLTYDELA